MGRGGECLQSAGEWLEPRLRQAGLAHLSRAAKSPSTAFAQMPRTRERLRPVGEADPRILFLKIDSGLLQCICWVAQNYVLDSPQVGEARHRADMQQRKGRCRRETGRPFLPEAYGD